MKRIFVGLMALTILSATLYADNGKTLKKVKSTTECCAKGCYNESCMNTKTVYANKRGLVIHQGGNCTCC